MNRKSLLHILLASAAIILIVVLLYYGNNRLAVSEYTCESERLPKTFSGYKIVQVSDLHNKNFGKNQKRLINKIHTLSPDIIVITGDLIDRRRKGMDAAMDFINQAAVIAPVYYVQGNHEVSSPETPELLEKLSAAGVKILDGKIQVVELGEEKIYIAGVSDPEAYATKQERKSKETLYINGKFKAVLANAVKESGGDFTVLLSHRPSILDIYAEFKFDLVFSGHAHGGQVRLPFVGGLIAPDEGFLPKYTQGMHQKNTSTLIISRGLGNSMFPLRIFNRPEIVCVTLGG